MRKVKDIKTYIGNLTTEIDRAYDDIITVEHRSNNQKRDYLFVNKIQCKHIPNSPSAMIKMCKDLAYRISIKDKSKTLVIGFAETATAIGSIVAENILVRNRDDIYVMHTTREDIERCLDIINFEEEHSHATTQKLLGHKDVNINDFKTIIFVEDEISTGNTIINFVKAFKEKYDVNDMEFIVASICNWQSEENKAKFTENNIWAHSLIAGKLKDVNAKMFSKEPRLKDTINIDATNRKEYEIHDFNIDNKVYLSERLGHNRTTEVAHLDEIKNLCKEAKTVRVIGTEEFMTIPIKIGAELEKQGKTVLCHSTTRSKIDVLKDSLFDGHSSGIKSRYEVKSFYEDKRKTYIYNLEEKVDLTLIITDTPDKNQFNKALKSLAQALGDNTNKIIGIRL